MVIKRTIKKWYEVNRQYVRQGLARRRINAHPTVKPSDLPERILATARCAFVLSTGRCGTGLLTKLLESCDRVDVHHMPDPELLYPSKRTYHMGVDKNETFKEVALHARYELVRKSFRYGNYYIETNNRVTFYAPYLSDVFLKAKFIHLVRHPQAFVRSGLRRGYYVGHVADEGRITPRESDPVGAQWNRMTQTAKIAWLWNATQQYIEECKETISDERFLTVQSEDLFNKEETTLTILQFLGTTELSRSAIAKRIRRPVHAQSISDKSPDEVWSADQINDIKQYATLASRYGYEICPHTS